MRKTLNSLWLCLVLVMSIGTATAAAQEDTSPGGYYYNPEEPLIGDPQQLSSNSVFISEASASEKTYEGVLMALIDGNTDTFFQSYWNRGVFSNPTLTEEIFSDAIGSLNPESAVVNGAGWHNLQVALFDPVQVFFFTFTGRNAEKYCDTPSEIVIYATNDDALGGSTLASESAQWTKITELKDGLPGSIMPLAKYASSAIDMGEAYKYIRFEVRNTVTSDDGGSGLRPTARPEISGRVFDLAEFQIYEGVKIEGYRSRLDSLVNAVAASGYDFPAGDDPGLFPKAVADNYNNAYQETLEKYILDLSDAECKELYDKLYSALNAVLGSERNPLEDGYYNIVSAWNVFENQQGVQKAWYYESEADGLYWTTYDKRLPIQLFKLEKQADGNWSVQNVVSKKYLYHLPKNAVPVPFSDGLQSEQVFQPFASKPYEFKIYSPDFNSQYNKYNTRQHTNGTAVTGMVSAWDSDMDGEATWLLKRVSGELLDSLLRASDSDRITAEMRQAMADAQKQYDKCYEYKSIFTDAGQMTTNSQNPSDGSIGALLDGNTGTYFHSNWDAAYKSAMATGGTGWHNMQFSLPKAVDKVKFYYAGRINSSGWVDDPDHITIYGTNDDALAESTAAADSLYWTMILDMNKPEYAFPVKNNDGSTFTSPVIDLGGNYKCLRFVVKHTNGQGTMGSRMFYDPSVSGVTFELSEFRLWDGNPTDDSEALHIEGMPEACQALADLIESSRAKIVAGTATDADIAALKAATDAVAKLYVNRDSLDQALADALKEAKTVYDEQTGSKVNILTSASQLSSNSVDYGTIGAASAEAALENLLDNNINTTFHSFWNRSVFSAATVTEETFLDAVANASKVAVNGTGYHNLQVKFDAPRSSFYFTMTARNDATYHDTPNDIAIYATNDDTLGESTLDSETPQWEQITELNENMPENTQAAYWESPLIEMGQNYKYVRFVVKDITRIANRPTTAPEITGVVFNISEFHVYGGQDPASLPYTHDADLKAAVDALKPLIDEYSAIEAHKLYTAEPVEKLKTAIDKVNSFTVDTTEMITLYANYCERIENSVVGKGIGYVDSEASLEAFAEAITAARQAVSVPSKIAVDKAVNAMKDAYAEFMTHVEQIAPNTWYNILSASTREVFTGQPIHLEPAAHGDDLRIGGYDIDARDPQADPYAVWKFIPVEGTGNFYIQNLGTGQYIGDFVGNLTTMRMQHEPVAYRLIYFGDGGFRITQAANADDKLAFKTDKSNGVIFTYPLNSDNQQVFTFDEVSVGGDMNLADFKDNSIQIITLPYDAKGDNSISALNGGKAETYAVKAVSVDENGTRLELRKIADTEAGVPFILVVGDIKQAQADGNVTLELTIPEVSVSDGTEGNNGLVGTLAGVSVTQPGLGMFLNSKLYSTTTLTTPFAARSGYINPGKVVNEDGDADLVIETKDILNSIAHATVAPAGGKVSVYTIEGTLVRRNADAANAKSGLAKGVYIIGGKKVMVK